MSEDEQRAQEAAAEFMRTVPVQDVVVSMVQTVFDVGYRRTGLVGGAGTSATSPRPRLRSRPCARSCRCSSGCSTPPSMTTLRSALSELQLAYADAAEQGAAPADTPQAAEPPPAAGEPGEAQEPPPAGRVPSRPSGRGSGHPEVTYERDGRDRRVRGIGVLLVPRATPRRSTVDTPYGPTSDRFTIGDDRRQAGGVPAPPRPQPPAAAARDPLPGEPVGDARAGRAPPDRAVRVGQPRPATCRRGRSWSATSSSTARAAAPTRSTTAR